MAERPTGRSGKSNAGEKTGKGESSAKRWAAAKPASGDAKPRKPPKAPKPPKPGQPQTGRPKPSPEAIARAKAKLAPPPAPWHPLPLAEMAIVIGFLAILLAAYLADRDGVFSGFLLIMLGTAEFSWREHRHGYRPHATVLALMLGVVVAALLWRVVGLNRNVCVITGFVLFTFAWGILDREYVPAAKRAQQAAEAAEGAGDDDAPAKP